MSKMEISEDLIEELILEGAVEFSGVDSRGEILFSFTDKIDQVAPKVRKHILEMQMKDINQLWLDGYITFDDLTSERPMVSITEKSLKPEELDKLDMHKRVILEQLIQITRE